MATIIAQITFTRGKNQFQTQFIEMPGSSAASGATEKVLPVLVYFRVHSVVIANPQIFSS